MDNGGRTPIITAFGIGIAFVIFSLMFADPLSSPDIQTEVEDIDLAIAGLKNTYEAGEPIIFSVKAEGFSDSEDIACNSYPPAVAIRNDSNGEEMILNPFRLSTALLCMEMPRSFDVEFTFGDKEDILLDKEGSYTVLASYDDLASFEDISIEKKFIVTR